MKAFLVFSFIFPFCFSFAQVTLPYATDFESGLPTDWMTNGFWKPLAGSGISQSSAMAARDHIFILFKSELTSPSFDLSTLHHPMLHLSLVLGRFTDGASGFSVHVDYGKGWKPLYACSEHPEFWAHNYPGLTYETLPSNIYTSNDTSTWFPTQQVPFRRVALDLDSVQSYQQVRFKFVADFYYGGLVFLDDLSIKEAVVTDLHQDTKNHVERLFFPNPVKESIRLDLDEEVQNLQLCNIEGRILLNRELFKQGELDVRHLPSGVYVLQYLPKEAKQPLHRRIVISN